MTEHPSGPWATNDHDPTDASQASAPEAVIATEQALKWARADIHSAVATTGDTRRQYARSAADHAATVLLSPYATDTQRQYARYYLDDSQALAR